MEQEQSWNFNAPQFVDFNTNPFTDDREVESYFEFDHENGVPVSLDKSTEYVETSEKRTPLRNTRSKTPKSKTPTAKATPIRNTRSKTPKATDEGKSKENITPQNQNMPLRKSLSTSKLPDMKATPKNLCTNLEDWRKKTAGAKTSNNQAVNGKKEVLIKPGVKRSNTSVERSESGPKKVRENAPRNTTPCKGTGLKRSNSFNPGRPRSIDRPVRNHTRGLSVERSSSQKRGGSAERNGPVKSKELTVANTPTCLRRKPMKATAQQSVKNTEDMELEKIKLLRQELAKSRKKTQESYKKAIQGPVPTPANHTIHKEVTTAHEFHFETDKRIKTHGMETRRDRDVKDFASILRSNKEKSTNSGPLKAGPTIPEPFHLNDQRKRKLPDLDEKQAEKYESMAQRLAQFNATPERFRSRPKTTASQTRGRSRSPPNQGITVPKTPQFETRTRSRPVVAPSRVELEQKEVEECKKNQFKAKPVNHRIFTNPNLGVKKVPRKAPTIPEGFHLSSDRKARERDNSQEHENEHYEFHAKPLNKKILEGIVGVKDAKPLPPTIPESPAFALKHRARMPVAENQEKEDAGKIIRAHPVPHAGLPFVPKFSSKITVVEPFGFDEREEQKIAKKEQKINEIKEEEKRMREFHANPIPDHEPHLPPKKTKGITVQQPFNLGTETRGMRKAEEWSHKLEEELRQQKEKAKFKAREPHVLESEPFLPAKANKYTTEFSEFEMSTAKRSVKREAFEMYKKTKQDEIDNIRIQEQRMKEAEEQAELERLRQEAVPKAQPVKHYKPVNVHSSTKPLTEAMSPRFKTDQRLRLRAHLSESCNSLASS